ncbi:MAG TPA: hypothetical protein VNR37_03885 [Microbacteriaceae bacterium]|nr:hypothetical protein [Microbacteriaceae bacterium]
MPMPNRTVVIAFSSLSAVGLLAGCATPTPEPAPSVTEAPTTAPPVEPTTSTAAEPAPVVEDGFADGTYTADGAYVAPSGPETITVTVTLADGAVAAVEVAGHASDPQARRHQADFISGIAAAVVGQPIEGLAVDRVAGSSLTGQGFNAALDAIRAEAAA